MVSISQIYLTWLQRMMAFNRDDQRMMIFISSVLDRFYRISWFICIIKPITHGNWMKQPYQAFLIKCHDCPTKWNTYVWGFSPIILSLCDNHPRWKVELWVAKCNQIHPAEFIYLCSLSLLSAPAPGGGGARLCAKNLVDKVDRLLHKKIMQWRYFPNEIHHFNLISLKYLQKIQ